MRRAARTLAVGAIGSALSAAAAPTTRYLAASTPQLAGCLPNARVSVSVDLTAETRGFDIFQVTASGLPKSAPFTVFLLEQAGQPFGAASYIGDFTTDATRAARNTYQLIVEEAFSSTLVGTQRVRKELNQIGIWFADPKGDDFCLGANSPVTPFDGDNQAGVQAFNSAKAAPLP